MKLSPSWTWLTHQYMPGNSHASIDFNLEVAPLLPFKAFWESWKEAASFHIAYFFHCVT